MRNTFFFCSILTTGLSQAQQFQHSYGGIHSDEPRALIRLDDGNYLMAGYSNSFGQSSSAYLVKVDGHGNVIWQKATQDSSNSVDAIRVTELSDGNLLLGGTHVSGPILSLLMKTDALGNPIWERTFKMTGTTSDLGFDAIETTDGNYVLGGYNFTPFTGYDVFLVETYPNGTPRWGRRIGSTDHETFYRCIHTSDKGFLIVGAHQVVSTSDFHMLIVKTDSLGNVEWNKVLDGAFFPRALDAIQTPDGAYLVLGSSTAASDNYTILIKLTSAGAIDWAESYGMNGFDMYGLNIEATASGDLLIVGTSIDTAFDQDAVLFKVDSNGNILGAMSYSGNGNDAGRDVVFADNDSIVLLAATESFAFRGGSIFDYFLIKTDQGGVTGCNEQNIFLSGVPLIFTEVPVNLLSILDTSYILPDPFTAATAGADSLICTPSVGVEDVTSRSLSTYPNPSSGVFTISLDAPATGSVNVALSDLVGKQVVSKNVAVIAGHNTILLDSPLPGGMYVLTVSGQDVVLTVRVVIQAK